jgi:OOP family OmpA-OmpF porin
MQMTSKTLNSNRIAMLGIAAIAINTMTVHASPGYLTDITGAVVSSNNGDCVKTGAWTSELGTPDCDAALAARLEAERLAAEQARLAADLAKLESPAAIAKPALARVSDSGNVMFEFNSAVLTPAAKQQLDMIVGKIGEFDVVEDIRIVGHTDNSGPDMYNLTLSERRAASVGDYLASRGVSKNLLSTAGKGETSPIADNMTREGRARNRRVDILISGNADE